jgi:hypothetical protein
MKDAVNQTFSRCNELRREASCGDKPVRTFVRAAAARETMASRRPDVMIEALLSLKFAVHQLRLDWRARRIERVAVRGRRSSALLLILRFLVAGTAAVTTGRRHHDHDKDDQGDEDNGREQPVCADCRHGLGIPGSPGEESRLGSVGTRPWRVRISRR